jgi:zinc and cadmium transporter
MTEVLLYSLVAVFLISLISFVGVLGLVLKRKVLDKLLLVLVAFAAGALLGAAFFDLIPESFEVIGNFYWVVVGIVFFFLIESVLHWHHSHNPEGKCKKCIRPVAYLNLIADGFHNFIDGVIIVAGFLIGVPAGITIAIAIALHEIPQEIGDFAILVHGGFSRFKALMFNFLSALMALLGVVIGYFALSSFENWIPYVIAIAAGGFIYIAGTDLIPELHKEKNYLRILLQIVFLIFGVGLMWFVGMSH